LLAVFTQTNPGPPPGAAVFAAAAAAGPSFFGAGADPTGAPAGTGALMAGGALVAAAGAGIDAAGAAYHVCTPLCPRHAPLFDSAVEYDPSLQIPVAPAGACAKTLAAPNTHTPAIIQIVFVIAGTLESPSAFITAIRQS
jgi:hypothetical protein